MTGWNIPAFLFAADEIDDLTLSQACETTENENYAFENLGILSLNNEAENATLTQACEVKWSKTRHVIWKTSRFHRF